MSSKTGLTAAKIRYLIALAELDPEGKGVRSVVLASKLGVSRPSVHTMITRLEELGFVEKEFYGIIYMTEEGKQASQRYAAYFKQFHESIGSDDAASEAVNILAASQNY